jgi:dTDP-4-dehydrorhamnose reductase
MKTILVTGSNGLLGQKITEAVLKDESFHLVATGIGLNRFTKTQGYVYAEMDICDPLQVRAVLKKYKPDAVIHTAALTDVDKSELRQEDAWRLNVESLNILTDICSDQQIHLVHLSTDFIFDGANGPYDEEALPNPLSFYGKTKLAAEEVVKNSACSWAILRTVLVFGIISDASRSNIVLWAKNALEKGQAIKVVNDQWRTPTLAEDLATGCLLAVDHNATGIYNICGKDFMSVSELVYQVADYWKLDKSLITEVSSVTLDQKARRPVRTGFMIEKAVQDLGYKPHSFAEGLQLVNQQLAERHEF